LACTQKMFSLPLVYC